MHIERCDVLIVGAGGAALRAAIAAHEQAAGAQVLVATKGELGKSGVTATACSDRMAFHATLPTTEPGGSEAWRYHADDIYRIGGYVSDGDLAQILARHAARAFEDLDRWGVPFVRKPDGTVDQFVTDGSQYARACYTGPYTANHIEAALVRQVRQRPIHVLERTMIATLLPTEDGGHVAGALAVHESGMLTRIEAKAVVLATGGAGQVFAVSVFPPDCTGDGYAMAYRLGAQLVNLEFIQIGLSSLATNLACSGSMMRALPRVVDESGREFLPDYFPPGTGWTRIHNVLFAKGASWPVSWREPSRVIDIAVFYERAAGRKVYLDYSANPADLDLDKLDEKVQRWYRDVKGVDLASYAIRSSPLERLRAINPQIVQWLVERGIDLAAGEAVEIAPAVQHFQGGVKIRRRGETSVPGLFAAGETAGGQHGANRPGGNALLDSQVFGRIAGENAAVRALSLDAQPKIDKRAEAQALAWLGEMASPTGASSATEVRKACQEIMSSAVSVVRVQERLERALIELQNLERQGIRADEKGLSYAIETANILLVGRLIATAAHKRTESRGPHLMFAKWGDMEPIARDDEKWQRYIVLQKADGGIAAEVQVPVPME